MNYTYARCNSCGWRADATEEHPAAELLAAHAAECPFELRQLLVPMWSVSWPWYHSDESVAHRRGEGPPPPFGLEMSWQPVGSHSTLSPFGTGMDPKKWHLFPPLYGHD